MATVNDSIPHVVRTAEDPRQQGVWTARLSRIEQVNPTIRLLRLSLPKDGVCNTVPFPFFQGGCEVLVLSFPLGSLFFLLLGDSALRGSFDIEYEFCYGEGH